MTVARRPADTATVAAAVTRRTQRNPFRPAKRCEWFTRFRERMIHPSSATYESTGILPRTGSCGAREMSEFESRMRSQDIHRIRPNSVFVKPEHYVATIRRKGLSPTVGHICAPRDLKTAYPSSTTFPDSLRTTFCDPARQGSGTSKRKSTKVAALSWRRPRRRSNPLEMLVCPTHARSSTQKQRVCKRALSTPCPSPPFCNPASSRFSHGPPSAFDLAGNAKFGQEEFF